MSTHIDTLIVKFEKLNTELVDFVSGLSEDELKLAGDEQQSASIGEVVVHLGEGAPEVLGWLVGATNSPAPTHRHDGHGEHHHHHHHGHDHDHHQGKDDVAAALRDSLAQVVALLRTLGDEQLAVVPPAAPGLTDGTKPLGEVIDVMIGHQAEHLAYMRGALARSGRDA